MIAQVQEENGNKVAIPISGSIPTGLPVGTWISFEKDQAPDNKWIKAGETFDENLYPALYLFLGTNKVPERFDHNRLSAYENITLPTSSATAITMQYDGTLVYQGDNGGTHYVYINDVQICFDKGSSSDDSALTVSFRKGDVIWVTTTGNFVSKVAYYKHPMFIKATSAIEITDQSTFLNTVQSLVQTSNSYSTEEQATGGFWIDGKPIYKKTIFYNNKAFPYQQNTELFTDNTIDTLVKWNDTPSGGVNNNSYLFAGGMFSPNWNDSTKTFRVYQAWTGGSVAYKTFYLDIEYTKN